MQAVAAVVDVAGITADEGGWNVEGFVGFNVSFEIGVITNANVECVHRFSEWPALVRSRKIPSRRKARRVSPTWIASHGTGLAPSSGSLAEPDRDHWRGSVNVPPSSGGVVPAASDPPEIRMIGDVQTGETQAVLACETASLRRLILDIDPCSIGPRPGRARSIGASVLARHW